MKKTKLTETEEIMKYLERKGFKLADISIDRDDCYFFKKNKILVGIKSGD